MQRGNERFDAVLRRIRRAVGVDADHQRGVPDVAEVRAGDVPAGVRRAGPRHRDPVAVASQQRACAQRDRERHRRLARRAAAVLDLAHARAGADRLGLAADGGQRAVAGVEADQRWSWSEGDHR